MRWRWWRRRTRAAGADREARVAGAGAGEGPRPLDTVPRWGEVGIHGVARPREWDAVAVADAPGVAADEVRFVALPDGRLLAGEGEPSSALGPLAEAVDVVLPRPFRAEAVRRDGARFAVGARSIETVELPGPTPGQELELVVTDTERTLSVDGVLAFERIPELERLASTRSQTYVAQASRLAGRLWEVRVRPL